MESIYNLCIYIWSLYIIYAYIYIYKYGIYKDGTDESICRAAEETQA